MNERGGFSTKKRKKKNHVLKQDICTTFSPFPFTHLSLNENIIFIKHIYLKENANKWHAKWEKREETKFKGKGKRSKKKKKTCLPLNEPTMEYN